MRTIILGLCAILVGCNTTPITSTGYAEQQRLTKQAAMSCFKQGLTPDSPQIQNCIVAELRAEDYRRSQNRATSAAIGHAGRQMQIMSMQQPTFKPMLPPPSNWSQPQRVYVVPNPANALSNHVNNFQRTRLYY